MMLLTAMGLNDEPPRPETRAAAGNRGVRRFIDVAVAGSAAAITLPLMTAIGLAIALTMGGPILFTQLRAGKDNRPFRLDKLDRKSRSVGKEGVRRVDHGGRR